MLFNSLEFIFLFLPIVWGGFFIVGRASQRAAALWLGAASLVFYGWWNAAYVPLLGLSIAGNYLLGRVIARSRADGRPARSRSYLIVAITANLLLLGYFKYANFLLDNLSLMAGARHLAVVLPLGISFFTFTQITYLVDRYRGRVTSDDWVHYVVFVTYFPHLIAGPILHHGEMMPQFERRSTYRPLAEAVSVGVTVFTIGLFKKVVIADSIAPFVDPAFTAATLGRATFVDAWAGALAYTLQLYFDFSGYSDMAVGLSRMFGISLPLNFNSPYKATNIADFWRRWHMTLSRLLRDYLYIPLGGGRHGSLASYRNLLVTMLIGGLWHGAGWTFVIWGGLHGAFLIVHRLWRRVFASAEQTDRPQAGLLRRAAARGVTFLAVVVGWVVFRSRDFHEAGGMLKAMAGLSGVVLPATWASRLGPLAQLSSSAGVRIGNLIGLADSHVVTWVAVGLAIVWWAPNTQEIMAGFDLALPVYASEKPSRSRLAWRPTPFAAVVTAIAALVAVASINRTSPFLYFQF